MEVLDNSKTDKIKVNKEEAEGKNDNKDSMTYNKKDKIKVNKEDAEGKNYNRDSMTDNKEIEMEKINAKHKEATQSTNDTTESLNNNKEKKQAKQEKTESTNDSSNQSIPKRFNNKEDSSAGNGSTQSKPNLPINDNTQFKITPETLPPLFSKNSKNNKIILPVFADSNGIQKHTTLYLEHDARPEINKAGESCEFLPKKLYPYRKMQNFVEERSMVFLAQFNEEKSSYERLMLKLLSMIENHHLYEKTTKPFTLVRLWKSQRKLNEEQNNFFQRHFLNFFGETILSYFIQTDNIYLETLIDGKIYNIDTRDHMMSLEGNLKQMLNDYLHIQSNKNVQEEILDKIEKKLQEEVDYISESAEKLTQNLTIMTEAAKKSENLKVKLSYLKSYLDSLTVRIHKEPLVNSVKKEIEEDAYRLFDNGNFDISLLREKIEKLIASNKYNNGFLDKVNNKIQEMWESFEEKLKSFLINRKKNPLKKNDSYFVFPDWLDIDEITEAELNDYKKYPERYPEIKKFHFYHAFHSGIRLVESSEEKLTLYSLLYKYFEKQYEILFSEFDSGEDQEPPNIVFGKLIDEYNYLHTWLESSKIELEKVYYDFIMIFDTYFNRILDGDEQSMILWKKLDFPKNNVCYSSAHPIIPAIIFSYKKLQSIVKCVKENEETEYFYYSKNLPRVTFLNLDGFDHPMNYVLPESCSKTLQIISVVIDGEKKHLNEILNKINVFSKQKKKKNFHLIPLRTWNKAKTERIPIKSAHIWETFQTIIFKLIESHAPSVIIISHSFSFYETVNIGNKVTLDPSTFARIVQRLSLISKCKVVLYPHIFVKNDIPKSDFEQKDNPKNDFEKKDIPEKVLKSNYYSWNEKWAFKDDETLNNNRRYVFEMVGSFIAGIKGICL